MERDRPEDEPVSAVGGKKAVKWAVLLAILISAVAVEGGCSRPSYVLVYNQTGVRLDFHVVRFPEGNPGPTVGDTVVLESSKRWRFDSLDIGDRLRLTSGRCDYDYGSIVPQASHRGMNAIVLQIGPDFVAHVLATGHDSNRIGQFRDEEIPGFPLAAVKTCR